MVVIKGRHNKLVFIGNHTNIRRIDFLSAGIEQYFFLGLVHKLYFAVPVADDVTDCILSLTVIGEHPYKLVTYKSVIQSPDVFPVNCKELKSTE